MQRRSRLRVAGSILRAMVIFPNLRFVCLLLRPHGAHHLLSLDVDGQHK